MNFVFCCCSATISVYYYNNFILYHQKLYLDDYGILTFYF